MSIEIIQQRLIDYDCQTVAEQENALKEMAQEIALMALSSAGFFSEAAFQGGTCLRILYGLDRFSEDLDFLLYQPNKHFDWQIYIRNMREEFMAYGYSLEMTSKTKLDKNIRMAFLKAESKGGILLLKDSRTNRPKMQIKLEIDVNPPQGSGYEIKYLDFPLPYSVEAQDLPSLFASKSHALLCRKYIKGRDWFDFVWYVSRKTTINFMLLANALYQQGPWQDKKIHLTPSWFIKQLKAKINQVNWDEAKQDVARFLRPRELASIEIWSKEFFLSRADKLESYL